MNMEKGKQTGRISMQNLLSSSWLQMGIVKLPRIRDCWSSRPGLGGFSHMSHIMSRAKFESILRNLRFCDNELDPAGDRLYKIRAIMEHLNAKPETALIPEGFFVGKILFFIEYLKKKKIMTKEAHRAIPVLSTPTMSVKQNHDRSETTTIAQEIPPPTYTSEFSQLGFPSTKSLKTLPESGRGSSQTELIPGSSQNHFMSSVYWLVNNHRKFAIRQILLVLAFTVVALLGGVVFYYSEKRYEKRMLRGQVTSLNALLANITTQFENVWNEGNSTDIQQFLRNSYKEMLQNENRYQLSALWKYDDGNYAWQYWPSVFYQTNIFMGVDYGNVPNQNGVGRLVLVITTCITLSLAQVVARDLGHWYLFLFTKLYAWINTGFRKAFELKPLEEVELPLLFCFGLLLGSWCLVSAFICGYDAAFGEDGINYWLSFYLAYETVTTIGVGDVMPKYTYKAPLWKFFCFFFGTPFRAVNHSTFVVVERSIFYPLTRVGDRITDFLRNRVAPEDKNIAQMTFPKDEMDQGMRNFITDRRDLYGGQYGRVRINANELDGTNDQKDQKDIAVVAQI